MELFIYNIFVLICSIVAVIPLTIDLIFNNKKGGKK
tara:strand:- start:409 stop:516 length:108 start_codon:yes stop_codon:yes gene_type:complete